MPGCVIAGGGPAGMILGLLLARRGVPVRVLEAHKDFDRDFRGDTIHPSTLELLDAIGLADDLHRIPHAKLRAMRLVTAERTWTVADFGRLRTRFPYIMVMPQEKFLAWLHEQVCRYEHFELTFRARVHQLIEQDGIVEGVRFQGEEGEEEVRADLTVAADGRSSRLRKLAGFEPRRQSPEMDVLWFRLPKQEGDRHDEGGFFIGQGHLLVLLERDQEWQGGYVIPKGGYKQLKEDGLRALHANIASLVPWLANRVDTLDDWSKVQMLTVQADCLSCWHKPGLLFIGDAAHAMSPVGGVGINYAIGDAVEAVNVLAGKLREGKVADSDLADVQRRREPAVRIIQRFQGLIQRRVVGEALRAERPFRPPLALRILLKIPFLRDIPAKMIAFGPSPPRLEREQSRDREGAVPFLM